MPAPTANGISDSDYTLEPPRQGTERSATSTISAPLLVFVALATGIIATANLWDAVGGGADPFSATVGLRLLVCLTIASVVVRGALRSRSRIDADA